MKSKGIFFNYFNIILFSWTVLLLARLAETLVIVLKFGELDSLFLSETIGLGFDFLFVSTLLILVFPIYWALSKASSTAANIVFLSIILIFSTLHFLLLGYFVHQLKPLDVFLFQYTLEEVYLTVKTSGVNTLTNLVFILVFALAGLAFFVWLTKRIFRASTVKIVYLLIFVSLPLFLIRQVFLAEEVDKFALNKSVSFYSNTIKKYCFEKADDHLSYSQRDAKAFQEANASKTFIDFNYPLLRHFEQQNVLKPYFREFDTAPNIVILLVEGLNDDFIHEYRGAELMPFLSDLKRKSLYWDRCFTLGERSFAAIPSITGSLPYAGKGFMGLKANYPRHFSLVSVLNANNYFTTFFYGQASWFNKKDRFFEYNNIDSVLDNSKFDDKYQKIVEENYFWGYNDKDLYRQSLEIIAGRSRKPYLDIYFTGTSHSPYRISEHEKYEAKFQVLLEKLENKADVDFFQTYKKYVLTLIFVDDALEEFISESRKSEDFENTIFIITGDHPMTEMPIENSLKRYHVPLLFYSDKLIKPDKISGKTSHLDIYESLLSLLADYGVEPPEYTAALGGKLPVSNETTGTKLFFMNDNREIIDYLSGTYYLTGEELFRVGVDLDLTKIDDKNKLQKLKNELDNFRKTSEYVSLNNKILPDTVYHKGLLHHLYYAESYLDSINFNKEFHNLIPGIEVRNKVLNYDIDFDYSIENSDKLLLVFQLSTNNDSVVLWQTRELKPSENSFHRQLIVRQQKVSDSLLKFKTFIWNRSQAETKISNVKVAVWGQ
ncbi:MAG: sulfatase-like hydrolase/transferase [Bacteroidales bacterium]|nr:sulfatase-like hydrolase/transferase [Bacteroidales bacterium]